MGKLWAIIKREYLERVRSKWFLIATFLGPVFFAAIIIIPAWLASRSRATSEVYNTTIIDATSTGFGQRLAVAIAGDNPDRKKIPQVLVVPPAELVKAESTATRDVMSKSKVGYLVVTDQTVAGETAKYAGSNASSIPDMTQIRTALRQTILASRLEKIGIETARTKELTFIPLNFTTERITERGRGGSGMASVMFGFAIGFLLYMTIIIYGQTIMSSVIEEKTSRVAEVVMSSVPTDTLLVGKVLGVGAVGLTQQVLWVATTYVLLRVREPIMAKLGAPTMSFSLPEISLGAAMLFLTFFILGFIFYSSLYAAVGSAVNSEQEARQAATPLMIMVVFAGVFIQPVLLNPTGTTALVLSLLPITSPIIMPIRMAVTGVAPLEMAASIGLLLLGCAAALWLASRIYRVGLLMYGKKPTMREMMRWVSYSRLLVSFPVDLCRGRGWVPSSSATLARAEPGTALAPLRGTRRSPGRSPKPTSRAPNLSLHRSVGARLGASRSPSHHSGGEPCPHASRSRDVVGPCGRWRGARQGDRGGAHSADEEWARSGAA